MDTAGIIHDSTLRLNKAKNNGGSLLIRHSQAIIQSCTFSHELAALGCGGAISAENVANVTIQRSSIDNCTASCGGSVSITSESILKIEHSNIANSIAVNGGGSVYIFQNSFLTGNNITVVDGKSVSGAGIYVHDSSELHINIFNFYRNTANKSGGAIYCQNGKFIMEEGNMLNNDAKLYGGGVFGDKCQVTFDHSNIVNNTTLRNRGGMYFMESTIEMYNTKGVNNIEGITNNFGFIRRYSKFQSNYLYLPDAERNCIVIERNSLAEMTHTYLTNFSSYCPIRARDDSQIVVYSVYLTNYYTQNIVCADASSKLQGTIKG